jgi:hypothetical protein
MYVELSYSKALFHNCVQLQKLYLFQLQKPSRGLFDILNFSPLFSGTLRDFLLRQRYIDGVVLRLYGFGTGFD